jgi:ActR/RegA family two-component response regulator
MGLNNNNKIKTQYDFSDSFLDLDLNKMFLSRIEYEIQNRHFNNAVAYIFTLLEESLFDPGVIGQLDHFQAILGRGDKKRFNSAMIREYRKLSRKLDLDLIVNCLDFMQRIGISAKKYESKKKGTFEFTEKEIEALLKIESLARLYFDIIHDFNDSLNTINDFAALAKKTIEKDKEPNKIIENLNNGIKKLNDLYKTLSLFFMDVHTIIGPLASKEKILIIEGEEAMGVAVREILGKLGYESDFATGRGDFIKLYLKAKQTGHPYDGVIVSLSDRAGDEEAKNIIEGLKTVNPNVRILFVSGCTKDKGQLDPKKLGLEAILKKPYEIDDFRKVFSAMIMKN